MTNFYVLLNDGASHILLNDGTSAILLNDEGAVTPSGVVISGTHAKPVLSIGPRRKQIIPIEFTFWLKSELIRKTKSKLKLKSTLLTKTEAKIAIKSTILILTESYVKLKSSLVISAKRTTIGIKSSIIYNVSETFTLISKISNPRLRKVLLRKLKEVLED